MASKYAQVVMLLAIIATLLAVGEARRNLTEVSQQKSSLGFNFTAGWPWNHPNHTQNSSRIVVGGEEKWHSGFNYAKWALKNSPFYINDTLVFKFDPPSNATPPHSVYLLPNYWSYLTCDVSGATKVADVAQGGGKGFEFVLKKWKPHYFASGEHNGEDCKAGQMKFAVMPFFHLH